MSSICNIIKERGLVQFLEKCFFIPYNTYIRKCNQKKLAELRESFKNAILPEVENFVIKQDERVVISVTSFPKRFDQLVITLKSIILQDVAPGKIIVYLGSDTKESDITTDMHGLKRYGVEYRIDNTKNLKGHKKYFYALQEFKDKSVITIDDDIIFPSTMISELLVCHEKYPKAVCARRVHRIISKRGHLLPYNSWDIEYARKSGPSNRMFATTGAGTLYSPYVNAMLCKDTFDEKAIQDLCLEADDVWMKCMEIKSNIKVVKADIYIMGAFINVEEADTLMAGNVGDGRNDIFMHQVIQEYGIKEQDFTK